MGSKYNVRSSFRVTIGQMQVGDVGYVGGGGWRRTKAGFYTSPQRFLCAEDETHIVRVRRTVDGVFCVPCDWMLKLEVEKTRDMPAGLVRIKADADGVSL